MQTLIIKLYCTLTFVVWSNPSIWLSSSSRIRCTSLSAPVWASNLLVAIASISSATNIATYVQETEVNLNFILCYQPMYFISKTNTEQEFWRLFINCIHFDMVFTTLAGLSICILYLPMNMMEGEFSFASRNTSLTILGPSPKYFCTNSLPTTRMKEAVVWWATALANIVLPHPTNKT